MAIKHDNLFFQEHRFIYENIETKELNINAKNIIRASALKNNSSESIRVVEMLLYTWLRSYQTLT